MSAFTYNCPHCDKELEGSYWDNVYCDICDITFETDYTERYDDECECTWSWLTGIEKNGNHLI